MSCFVSMNQLRKCLGVLTVLGAACCLAVPAAQATMLSETSTGSLRGYINDDGHDGVGNWHSDGEGLKIAKFHVGGPNATRVGYTGFVLPGAPSGEVLTSAELTLVKNSGAADGYDLGLYHSVAALDPTGGAGYVMFNDYNLGSFGYTRIGTLYSSAGAVENYTDIDVTAAVTADYGATNVRSLFMLVWETPGTSTPVSGQVGGLERVIEFNGADPLLELTFAPVPEPSSLAMMGLAGLLTYVRRRR